MLSVVLFAVVATLQPNLLVTTSWLADHAADTNVVVIDVTTPQEYVQGHIPGARLIDQKDLILNHKAMGFSDDLPSTRTLERVFTRAGIADAQHIVIYSRDPLLATRAFFTLDYLGYGNRIAILDGGFPKWTAENRHVTTEAPVYAAVPFKIERNRAALITKGEVKNLLKMKDVVLIDARMPKEFVGTEPGKGVTVSGHIPTAKCVPCSANLEFNDQQITVYKSEADLRGMYTSLTPAESRKIVVYCRTGLEASMTYFVLRYLGYQPALYDGSYVDWNKTEPVARAASVNP